MIHRAALETVDHYAECIFSVCESLFSGQKQHCLKKECLNFPLVSLGLVFLDWGQSE